MTLHEPYNGRCRKRNLLVTIHCVKAGVSPACECIRCDHHTVTCSAVHPDFPKPCGTPFERLADQKVVPCILTTGHWPKTAHAFAKDE